MHGEQQFPQQAHLMRAGGPAASEGADHALTVDVHVDVATVVRAAQVAHHGEQYVEFFVIDMPPVARARRKQIVSPVGSDNVARAGGGRVAGPVHIDRGSGEQGFDWSSADVR